jgi:hypothetical protein
MSDRPDPDLATLVAPARAALDDPRTVERSVRLARARSLSGARPPSRRTRPLPIAKLGLAFAALALALVALLVTRRGPAVMPPAAALALTFTVDGVRGAVGTRLAPAGPSAIRFDDGSELDLAPPAALRVIALDERGGRLVLEQGTLHASFRHRDRTSWTIEAGGVVVEVTGTRFDVSFDPAAQAFELLMHEGSVRVRGCGLPEGQVVSGTASVTARCAPSPTPSPSPSLSPPPPPPPPPSLSPPPPPADLSLSLLSRADTERQASNLLAARATLREVRQRFPRGAGAPQAAFDLGVLAFDVDHDFTSAARWFRLYLDEAPRGPLAREALGRVMEAESRGGDLAGASATAARYLEMYPGGPHASLAKRLVTQHP